MKGRQILDVVPIVNEAISLILKRTVLKVFYRLVIAYHVSWNFFLVLLNRMGFW